LTKKTVMFSPRLDACKISLPPNGSEVAVALITKNDTLRAGAFDPGGDCRGPSVGRLNMADVQVIIGEDGTTHRVDQDGTVLNAEIYNGFRYELVQDAVAASRTVVSRLEVSSFALKNVEKSRRFAMRNLPHVSTPSSKYSCKCLVR
jgi:hypothetical protein